MAADEGAGLEHAALLDRPCAALRVAGAGVFRREGVRAVLVLLPGVAEESGVALDKSRRSSEMHRVESVSQFSLIFMFFSNT